MINIPMINAQGNVFKSQFYYAAFKEAGISTANSNGLICISHYHKEPLTLKKYKGLSESKELLVYPEGCKVDTSFVYPISREEYIIRGRVLQDEYMVDLTWLQKIKLYPIAPHAVLWSITFAFLICLLVGIFGFNMFYEGFTWKVAGVLIGMLLHCVFIVVGYTLLHTYVAIKFVNTYISERDDHLAMAGDICCDALEKGRLSVASFLATVEALEGDDDEIALFITAESYGADFSTYISTNMSYT